MYINNKRGVKSFFLPYYKQHDKYIHNVIKSPERGWLLIVGLPRRFAPREYTGIIAFVLLQKSDFGEIIA